MNKNLFGFALLILLVQSAFSQDEPKSELSGLVRTRYMSTNNERDLTDFNIMVTHGQLYYKTKLNRWLSFGTQANALFHYGTESISQVDPITGSGPIYEGNLWVNRNMTGSVETTLPQFYLRANLEGHSLMVGRIVKDTPILNAEPWPFTDAIQGIWYEYQSNKKLYMQGGWVSRLSPRQTGAFVSIGESLGLAGVGTDIFGNPSGYRGNVDSNYLLMGDVEYKFSESFKIDGWTFYADNVIRTGLIEATYSNREKERSISSMFIYQNKFGEGGNIDSNLAYKNEDQASYFGLRINQKMGNNNLQFNIGRITKLGRFLLPREWGLEPFYTFQRRTRIEGASDVASVMFRWQRTWDKENALFNVFSSIGTNQFGTVNDPAKNKFSMPNHHHIDLSVEYLPKQFKGLSAEIYVAQRLLSGDAPSDSFIINRANFFHFDFLLSYRFKR